jgi:hypothetical protein
MILHSKGRGMRAMPPEEIEAIYRDPIRIVSANFLISSHRKNAPPSSVMPFKAGGARKVDFMIFQAPRIFRR